MNQLHKIPYREKHVCPCCQQESQPTVWIENAVRLVLQSPYYNKTVCVVYRCPRCLCESWRDLHWDTLWLYPNEWDHSIVLYKRRCERAALHKWSRGLCGHCRQLLGGKIDGGISRDCPVKLAARTCPLKCKHYIGVSK